GAYNEALCAASINGNNAIVKMLLREGADPNVKGTGAHSNALCAASYKGHEAVVKVLLDNGADPNSDDREWYGSALHA
ncbi:hypothetical protein EJ04DRAFT_389255, partial [Polyplosphaeria fusca]